MNWKWVRGVGKWKGVLEKPFGNRKACKLGYFLEAVHYPTVWTVQAVGMCSASRVEQAKESHKSQLKSQRYPS